VQSSQGEAEARAAADALKAAGFDAYLMRADLGNRGVWYRVRVGRFASREEARQTAAKLRGSGRASAAIVQAYEEP
jgi:cell division septation protein DedD